jgi:hypothetical protein
MRWIEISVINPYPAKPEKKNICVAAKVLHRTPVDSGLALKKVQTRISPPLPFHSAWQLSGLKNRSKK